MIRSIVADGVRLRFEGGLGFVCFSAWSFGRTWYLKGQQRNASAADRDSKVAERILH